MLKKLGRYVPAALIAGVLAVSLLALRMSHGEVIEGFTPSGAFKTVGLSASGHLLVDQNGGLTQFVVWAGSPTVTAIQGTNPWIVGFGGTTQPVNFNGVGQPVNATQTTSPWVTLGQAFTTLNTSQTTCNGTAASILSASASAKGTVICNDDSATTAYIGGTAGVTTANGHALPPLTCYSPDNPGTYTGAAFCITAGTSIKVDAIQGQP